MKSNCNNIVKEDCFRIIEDNKNILKLLSGKKILITGANGFLMSYLVDVIAYWNHFFSKKKCIVFALDNSSHFKRLFYFFLFIFYFCFSNNIFFHLRWNNICKKEIDYTRFIEKVKRMANRVTGNQLC